MKVFVTGASGGLGSALIPKLLTAGHTVTGLARSDASMLKVQALGATPLRGDLVDLETCASAANAADAVLHLAFDHQQAFSGDFEGACLKDRNLIKAMADAMSSGSTLIIAGGTLGIMGDDETAQPLRNPQVPRYLSSDLASSYTEKGLRVIHIRLAPVTYNSDEPHDFIGMQIATAKEKGFVAYTEEGAWSACHYDDTADLYVLAIAAAKGLPNPINLHGTAEGGVPFTDIANVLGKKLGLPTRLADGEELASMGMVGMLMSIARPVKSTWTQEQTGWRPSSKSLISHLEAYELA